MAMDRIIAMLNRLRVERARFIKRHLVVLQVGNKLTQMIVKEVVNLDIVMVLLSLVRTCVAILIANFDCKIHSIKATVRIHDALCHRLRDHHRLHRKRRLTAIRCVVSLAPFLSIHLQHLHQ